MIKPVQLVGGTKWINRDSNPHSCGDKPAMLVSKGQLFWFKDGIYNRTGDKPAIIYITDRQYIWYKYQDYKEYKSDEPRVELWDDCLNPDQGVNYRGVNRVGDQPFIIAKSSVVWSIE